VRVPGTIPNERTTLGVSLKRPSELRGLLQRYPQMEQEVKCAKLFMVACVFGLVIAGSQSVVTRVERIVYMHKLSLDQAGTDR
jgi:hypothetical protein